MRRAIVCTLILTWFQIAAAQNDAWKIVDVPGAYERITGIAIDRDNHAWVVLLHELEVSRSYAVFTFDGDSWTDTGIPAPFATLDITSKPIVDNNGRIWVGGFREPYIGVLLRNNGTSWEHIPTPYSYGATHLAANRDGGVWALLTEPKYPGTSLLVEVDDTARTHVGIDLEPFYLTAIASDAAGRLWMTRGDETERHRTLLSVHENGRWTHFDDTPIGTFPGPMTVGLDGDVWIGSRGYTGGETLLPRGIVRFSKGYWWIYNTSTSPLPHNLVHAVAADRDSSVWIGTDAGLVHYDAARWTVYTTQNSPLPDDVVTALAVDGYGNKWIGTAAGRLVVFRSGGILGVQSESIPVVDAALSAYPNPFTRHATMAFTLARSQRVAISIYDVLGRRVFGISGFYAEGKHQVAWDAGAAPNGVYLCRVETERGEMSAWLVRAR